MEDPDELGHTRPLPEVRAATDHRAVLWFLIAAMLVILGTIAFFFIRHGQPQPRSPQTQLCVSTGPVALPFRT
jgi:hypothetical protein